MARDGTIVRAYTVWMRNRSRNRPATAPESSKPISDRPERGSHRPEERRRGPSRRGQKSGGSYWLYGIHAVAAAIGNPDRVIHQLLLTEEAENQIKEQLQGKLVQPFQRCDRSRLDGLCGRDAVHQGAAMLTDPLETLTIEDALDRKGPLLLLDQVTDPRNIGAILRSAAAFGAACVVLQDRNTPEETGTLAKAASGGLEVVPIVRVVNLSRALAALQSAGVWVVGLDAGGSTLDGLAFNNRRVALVLGAEGEGLRRLTRESCDEIAGLRMVGSMESLNVSNAAAVALYELSRSV